MNPSPQIDSASFRDPSGQVFYRNGEVFRAIFSPIVKDYEEARDKKIFEKLIDAKLLIPHAEEEISDFCPEGTVYCLKHPRLPMVSYPWEWPFSMLKDAAKIHLDMMEFLVPEGFWLRDANVFNIQYDGERLRLIDTLSVGLRDSDSPWVGYKQFCSHFIAPLACAAYCDIRTLCLWRNYIDGYPLNLAATMLPFWRRFIPGLFIHLTLHSLFQEWSDRKKDIESQKHQPPPKVSDRALIGMVRSLRRTIEGIKWNRTSKIWEKYDEIRTYQDEDIAIKSEYVDKVVRRVHPKIVWDLGGNTGEFSAIAASNGAFVVSIDGDPACTENIYHRVICEKGAKNILPLTMDFSNPSPSIGWDNRERLSLKKRGPADLVLALALVHHIVFSSNVPLNRIAEWFADITQYLIIEFVPPSDPMVKKLLKNRGDEHLPYSMDVFLSSFGKFFSFSDQVDLKNGRSLFLAERKKN